MSKTQRFHDKIRKLDKFEVKLGRLQEINGKYVQKGVDMRLGVDLVQMSMNKIIDKAIIITADSDFEYAVEKAQEAGITVSLAYFPNSKISKHFLESMNERIVLDDAVLERCKL
ncbi:MAG: NYN domain-containing protein [Nitrososphaerota archaeon]